MSSVLVFFRKAGSAESCWHVEAKKVISSREVQRL